VAFLNSIKKEKLAGSLNTRQPKSEGEYMEKRET